MRPSISVMWNEPWRCLWREWLARKKNLNWKFALPALLSEYLQLLDWWGMSASPIRRSNFRGATFCSATSIPANIALKSFQPQCWLLTTSNRVPEAARLLGKMWWRHAKSVTLGRGIEHQGKPECRLCANAIKRHISFNSCIWQNIQQQPTKHGRNICLSNKPSLEGDARRCWG